MPSFILRGPHCGSCVSSISDDLRDEGFTAQGVRVGLNPGQRTATVTYPDIPAFDLQRLKNVVLNAKLDEGPAWMIETENPLAMAFNSPSIQHYVDHGLARTPHYGQPQMRYPFDQRQVLDRHTEYHKVISQNFEISGMSCGSCAANVQKALSPQRCKGVLNASIHWQTGQATVQFDPQQISAQEICQIVSSIRSATGRFLQCQVAENEAGYFAQSHRAHHRGRNRIPRYKKRSEKSEVSSDSSSSSDSSDSSSSYSASSRDFLPTVSSTGSESEMSQKSHQTQRERRFSHTALPVAAVVPKKAGQGREAISSGELSELAPSCCGAPALGDLGEAADASKYAAGNKLDPVQVPHTPTKIAFSVLTAYITLAATAASIKTAIDFHQQEERINQALKQIDIITSALGETNRDLEALKLFLSTQRKDVRFVKWIPGVASSTGSTAVGTGIFIPAVGAAGLALGVVEGVAHMTKTGFLVKRYKKQIVNIGLDQSGRTAYAQQRKALQKEVSTSKKRFGGALANTIGIACLFVSALGMIGVAALAAPLMIGAFAAAGIATLLPGVVASVRYNPYKDLGFRQEFSNPLEGYTQDLQKRIDAGEKINPHAELQIVQRLFGGTREKLLDGLEKSGARREVADTYRKTMQSEQSGWTRFKNRTSYVITQIGSFACFGFPEKFWANQKRKVKEAAAASMPDNALSRRLATAQILAQINGAQVLSSSIDSLSDWLQLFSQIKTDAITAGGVMRLFAAQALGEKSAGWFKRNSAKTYFLKQPFAKIFSLGTAEEQKAVLENLKSITTTTSCCLVDVNVVFDYIQKYYVDQPQAQNSQMLSKLLQQKFDQYVSFGIPNESKSNARYYARYLAAYQQVEKDSAQVPKGQKFQSLIRPSKNQAAQPDSLATFTSKSVPQSEFSAKAQCAPCNNWQELLHQPSAASKKAHPRRTKSGRPVIRARNQ